MKSNYTANEIISIVDIYSSPDHIAKLKHIEGIREFYNDINMTQNINVSSLNPFFEKMIGPVFNPEQVDISDFIIFTKNLSRLLYQLPYKLDSFLAAKKFIKFHLKTFHKDKLNDSNPYFKAWKNAKLSIQPAEFKRKNDTADKKLTEKNNDVFYVQKSKIINFYNSFCKEREPDIIDKIIIVQATIGLRLIEALSSKVSNFRKNGNEIEQIGTAKNDASDRIVSKKPIIINSNKFMDVLSDVRRETDELLNLTNVELKNKYNGRVNDRIVKYLRFAGIPEHNELKSSHGLRRLYVAYAYSLVKNNRMTFHQFIKTNLGHQSNHSTINYNTIQILKSNVFDFSDRPDTDTQPTASSLSKSTAAKYVLYQQAVAEGKTSYEQLESVKIPNTSPQKYLTRNIITKFKKMNI